MGTQNLKSFAWGEADANLRLADLLLPDPGPASRAGTRRPRVTQRRPVNADLPDGGGGADEAGEDGGGGVAGDRLGAATLRVVRDGPPASWAAPARPSAMPSMSPRLERPSADVLSRTPAEGPPCRSERA